MDFYQEALKKLGWKEVTLWSRITDEGISFNHLEYGHNDGIEPVAKFPSQESAWKKVRWLKRIWFVDVSQSIPEVID